jgi:hypothetical protein
VRIDDAVDRAAVAAPDHGVATAQEWSQWCDSLATHVGHVLPAPGRVGSEGDR